MRGVASLDVPEIGTYRVHVVNPLNRGLSRCRAAALFYGLAVLKEYAALPPGFGSLVSTGGHSHPASAVGQPARTQAAASEVEMRTRPEIRCCRSGIAPV